MRELFDDLGNEATAATLIGIDSLIRPSAERHAKPITDFKSVEGGRPGTICSLSREIPAKIPDRRGGAVAAPNDDIQHRRLLLVRRNVDTESGGTKSPSPVVTPSNQTFHQTRGE